MKKAIAWALTLVLLFSLTACGGSAKELTKINQVKDLATGAILEVNQSTRKDMEKLYGAGTADAYGYEVYRDGAVKAAYDEKGVLQTIVFLDDTLFESLVYQAGCTIEEVRVALFEREPRAVGDGFLLLAAFNTQEKPCYSNSEDVLCMVSVTYDSNQTFETYYLRAMHLEEGQDVVPADAYEKDNTILDANLDAARLAVRVADQVLDFELTYEEGADQLSRLYDRMESGNTLNNLVRVEVSLLATTLDTQAYYERRGGTPDDKKLLTQRNEIAREIGEEQR